MRTLFVLSTLAGSAMIAGGTQSPKITVDSLDQRLSAVEYLAAAQPDLPPPGPNPFAPGGPALPPLDPPAGCDCTQCAGNCGCQNCGCGDEVVGTASACPNGLCPLQQPVVVASASGGSWGGVTSYSQPVVEYAAEACPTVQYAVGPDLPGPNPGGGGGSVGSGVGYGRAGLFSRWRSRRAARYAGY